MRPASCRHVEPRRTHRSCLQIASQPTQPPIAWPLIAWAQPPPSPSRRDGDLAAAGSGTTSGSSTPSPSAGRWPGGGAARAERSDVARRLKGLRGAARPAAVPARRQSPDPDRQARHWLSGRGCGVAEAVQRFEVGANAARPRRRPGPDHRHDVDQPVPDHARHGDLGRRRRRRDRHHQHARATRPGARRRRYRAPHAQAAHRARLFRPEDRPARAGSLCPPRHRPGDRADHLGQPRTSPRGSSSISSDGLRGARSLRASAIPRRATKASARRRGLHGALFPGRCRPASHPPGGAARRKTADEIFLVSHEVSRQRPGCRCRPHGTCASSFATIATGSMVKPHRTGPDA
jgi:hypothetical protein